MRAVTEALAHLQEALQGRYRFERELGQGGMATVYLAEDLKHRRLVALKVLRPEIAATIGAARFVREVEVAAKLQHPHILPLLDSGEVSGLFFYVMPYVEGESLRDRLAREGELPIPDAVRILMEVADALSEAHAHGVVHRDIKPDNVLLRGRHALVADFGVAKAVTEATGRQVLTSAGVALGTPAYMAPEQATADPRQDHRVDIYALGVLGYELLTGRPPFSAASAQEMLAAHVTMAPDPVEKWRPAVAPALAAVVMKCLAKKPADRWQSSEEVLQQLEPLTTPSGGATPANTRPTSAIGRAPRWAKWAAGVAAVGAACLLAAVLLRPPSFAVTVSDLTQLTSDPGVEYQPALSPDGSEVAYVAGPIQRPHLVIRSTSGAAGGGEIRLPDDTFFAEWFPSWSPDGEYVRFVGCPAIGLRGCTWSQIGKLGGAVLPAPGPGDFTAARSPDATRWAFASGDSILTQAADEATPRLVAVQHGEYLHDLHSLAWSPDGKRIAYVSGNPSWRRSGNVAPSSLWVVPSGGGEPQQLTDEEHLNVSPAWLDGRHLAFVSDRGGQRAVYVVEVGAGGGRIEARPVAGLADPHSITYAAATRRLAYPKFSMRQNIRAYPLGSAAPVSIRDGRPVTTGTQVVELHDVSLDGRAIVYDADLQGRMDLYVVPLSGGRPVPLTTGTDGGAAAAWSPDGREIAYNPSVANGAGPILVMPSGGGTPTAVTSDSLNWGPVWSPDGLRMAYESRRSGDSRIWIVTRDRVGGRWGIPRSIEAPCYAPDWTPGTVILCSMGGDILLVSPEDGGVLRRGILAAAGLRPALGIFYRYARDGAAVFATAVDGQNRRGVWRVPLAGGPPRLVVAFDDPSLTSPGYFSVSRDELFLSVAEYESDIWVATLHW
jgi:serine/threonine protein kinase/Tol biopolymer transport system component